MNLLGVFERNTTAVDTNYINFENWHVCTAVTDFVFLNFILPGNSKQSFKISQGNLTKLFYIPSQHVIVTRTSAGVFFVRMSVSVKLSDLPHLPNEMLVIWYIGTEWIDSLHSRIFNICPIFNIGPEWYRQIMLFTLRHTVVQGITPLCVCLSYANEKEIYIYCPSVKFWVDQCRSVYLSVYHLSVCL